MSEHGGLISQGEAIMPIIGSYSRMKAEPGISGSIHSVWSEKQSMPRVAGRVDIYHNNGQNPRQAAYGGSKGLAYTFCDFNLPPTNLAALAKGKAHSRLVNNEVLSRAGMGVNLSQASQAWLMVASRARQIATSVSRLKRGDVIGSLNALNPWAKAQRRIEDSGYTPHAFSNATSLVSPSRVVSVDVFQRWSPKRQTQWLKKETKRGAKAFTKGSASLWLEYAFGWAPLASDMYNAMDVLQQEFPVDRLRSSARAILYGPTAFPGGGVPGDDLVVNMGVICRVRADLEVTNPNLLLLNQLGLINPAAIAWDLVPFSFVVDWFVPVAKFINSWTADAGYTLKNTSYSLHYDVHVDYYSSYYAKWTHTDASRFIRERGLPSNATLFGSAKLPEPSRWLAATSVALIVQQLKTFR
ncbi:TPA_asm: maturation protein [ssRNA phage SRR7976323_4]|uniref:Maturation protein n=1 Tax=ssRNA phage SRR7976323_4 TaxID=2786691 RepID=A0A8S5L105_9VIRU|nr:maturation protein [ssRNA phage SRR7976323_4]DAD51163.1 TPA_asm: maturation protein [ssRNA phage SRR7976323_4]